MDLFRSFKYRRLYEWEILECRVIFGDMLNYHRVKIYDGVELPNFVDDIGRKLKKMEPRSPDAKNAITLGYRCFFGRQLPTELTMGGSGMCWLIHELTHVMQYQRMGWKYLTQALKAQKELGPNVYDYGDKEGLIKSRQKGTVYKEFNMEQQAHIVEDYYKLIRTGGDTSAWDPYIGEFRII
jgi:hypothetical protein